MALLAVQLIFGIVVAVLNTATCFPMDGTSRVVDFIDDNNEVLESEVLFYLHTIKNPTVPQQLFVNDSQSFLKSNFDVKKPTVFMTHGWKNSYLGRNCQTIKKAYLQTGDVNFIIIDWSSVAKLEYEDASKRLRLVGRHVANMVKYLKFLGSNLNDITIVGHSLGAQMVGLAGYQMKDKVGRIVGLDPAGALFEFGGTGKCISSGDAQIVEVIHTTIADLNILKRAVGDYDYYPNGGHLQPGCPMDGNLVLDCPHERAFEFFAEEIMSPNNLLSRKCDNYEYFLKGFCDQNPTAAFPGFKTNAMKEKGIYFLRTGGKEPFGLGEVGSKSPIH